MGKIRTIRWRQAHKRAHQVSDPRSRESARAHAGALVGSEQRPNHQPAPTAAKHRIDTVATKTSSPLPRPYRARFKTLPPAPDDYDDAALRTRRETGSLPRRPDCGRTVVVGHRKS
ncbi:hypothetical protein MTO96_004149 [Rhipicephalus appendiculatus]